MKHTVQQFDVAAMMAIPNIRGRLMKKLKLTDEDFLGIGEDEALEICQRLDVAMDRESALNIFNAQQVILHPASGVSNEGPRSRVLVTLPAVSWPWVPAWGSLEPPRRDGENAQKTGKNGGKMGEIRPKTCEGVGITWSATLRGRLLSS